MKSHSGISLEQAIEECEKEVKRNVNAESDLGLRSFLQERIGLSEANIADSIGRKLIKAEVVMDGNGAIDPKLTTVTKAEAVRLVEAVKRNLANAKENYKETYIADEKYKNDPATLRERQADFYGLHEQAALEGLTALEAANLLLIREREALQRHGVRCLDVDAPQIARQLLTVGEMRAHAQDAINLTINPLGEWLLRAKAKRIEYIPGLDFAVEQYPGKAHGGDVKSTIDAATCPDPAVRQVNKLRHNTLDAVIDKAIKQADSHEVAAVWPHLSDIAAKKTVPFTGSAIKAGLYYKDVNNAQALFTKNALALRLMRFKEKNS